jgi:WD40 repeat protein
VWIDRHIRRSIGHRTQLGQIAYVAISADDRLLVTATREGVISLWDPVKGGWIDDVSKLIEDISGLALSADGEVLIASRKDHADLLTWDVDDLDREPVVIRGCDSGKVRSLVSSRDGSLVVGIAARSGRRSACLWDTTGQPTRLLDVPRAGRHMVSCRGLEEARRVGSFGGSIGLWNLNGDNLKPMSVARLNRNVSEGSEVAPALSTDGRIIAVPDYAASVVVWDLESNEELVTLSAPSFAEGLTGADGFAFSDDGSMLYAYLANTVVAVPLDEHVAMNQLCQTLDRSLSREEWNEEEWNEFLAGEPYEPACR